MANKKNLANGSVAVAVGTGDTSITLSTGHGARMPATPFFATLTPAGVMSTVANSEIVSVTNVAGDVLTVTRAQKGTSALTFAIGDIIANGFYTEDLDEKVDVAATATTGFGFVIDEDNMASNLDTKVPTQQSVKAYTDALKALINSKTINPKFMQTGAATSTAASGFQATSITFPTAFNNTPYVFVSLNSTSSSPTYYTAASMTTTGFDFYLNQGSTTGRGIRWVAIDLSQPPFVL